MEEEEEEENKKRLGLVVCTSICSLSWWRHPSNSKNKFLSAAKNRSELS